jgi:small subunit ribosomal protein S16
MYERVAGLRTVMPVRLRLSLHGNRNDRIFHLVAIDLRKRRDAKPIELLGVYDPRLRLGQEHKTMHWSTERITYWLEKGGALPSKPVVKLLEWVRPFPFFSLPCSEGLASSKGGIIPPDSKYHPKSRQESPAAAPSSEPENPTVSPPPAQPSPA